MKHKLGLLLLSYFRFFAVRKLRQNPHAVIIGITGSAGKTSVRTALAMILALKGRVKQSSHANSESGIPLNILGIMPTDYSPADWLRMAILAPFKYFFNREKFDYYIAEMGIDSPRPPKNMDYLLSILRPDIAVVLNAGLTHSAEFDFLVQDRNPARRSEKIGLEIAKEKMKLAEAVSPQGVAVINTDQPELARLSRKLASRIITVGRKNSSALQILKVKDKPVFELSFSYQSHSYLLKLNSPLEAAYQYGLAAAVAAGAALGVSPDKAVAVLSGYRTPRGRMRIFPGVNSSHIIDSSYNASPGTVRSALEFLSHLAGQSHRIAVLGDMRELGLQAKPAHKELADWITKYSDECILFGELTAGFTLPVLESAKFPVRHFKEINSLNAYLLSRIKPNSWILVKGSQNSILLERAVAPLLADPADLDALARPGKYWDSVRASTP